MVSKIKIISIEFSYLYLKFWVNSIDKLISDHVSGQVDRTSYDSMRNYYFGDTKPGSSIKRFVAMVDDLIKRRDKKVLDLPTSK